MKTFSVARAFSAGVDLIERKPGTLIWWSLAILVLQLIPRMVVSHLAGANEFGAMHDLMGSLNDHAKIQVAQQHLTESQHALGAWGLVLWAWGLFVNAILYNAAFRSVIEPQKNGFGYLRLGAAELWQFAVQIVVFILVVLYAFVCAFLFGVIIVGAKAAGPAAQGWIAGIGIVLLALLTFWLSLRLSLGAVATYAERRFAYFDSWKLTKGVSWRLFWTGFLIVALLIGFYVMLLVGVIFSLLPLAGLLPSTTGAPAPVPAPHGLDVAELLSVASIATFVWMLLASVVAAVLQAFALTPWAEIYRSIKAGAEDAAH